MLLCDWDKDCDGLTNSSVFIPCSKLYINPVEITKEKECFIINFTIVNTKTTHQQFFPEHCYKDETIMSGKR